jgi:hypothetical protein
MIVTRAVVCSSAGQFYQVSLIDIKIDASCVVMGLRRII